MTKFLSICPPRRKPTPQVEGILHAITKETRMRVPEPLAYDGSVGVMTTSYIGDHCSLSTLFSCVSRAIPTHTVTPPLGPAIRDLVSCVNASQTFFTSVGQNIGKFLARLHDPKTARLLQQIVPDLPEATPGRAEYATRAIRDAIEQMRARIKDWRFLFANSTELNDLCEALITDSTRQIPANE